MNNLSGELIRSPEPTAKTIISIANETTTKRLTSLSEGRQGIFAAISSKAKKAALTGICATLILSSGCGNINRPLTQHFIFLAVGSPGRTSLTLFFDNKGKVNDSKIFTSNSLFLRPNYSFPNPSDFPIRPFFSSAGKKYLIGGIEAGASLRHEFAHLIQEENHRLHESDIEIKADIYMLKGIEKAYNYWKKYGYDGGYYLAFTLPNGDIILTRRKKYKTGRNRHKKEGKKETRKKKYKRNKSAIRGSTSNGDRFQNLCKVKIL